MDRDSNVSESTRESKSKTSNTACQSASLSFSASSPTHPSTSSIAVSISPIHSTSCTRSTSACDPSFNTAATPATNSHRVASPSRISTHGWAAFFGSDDGDGHDRCKNCSKSPANSRPSSSICARVSCISCRTMSTPGNRAGLHAAPVNPHAIFQNASTMPSRSTRRANDDDGVGDPDPASSRSRRTHGSRTDGREAVMIPVPSSAANDASTKPCMAASTSAAASLSPPASSTASPRKYNQSHIPAGNATPSDNPDPTRSRESASITNLVATSRSAPPRTTSPAGTVSKYATNDCCPPENTTRPTRIMAS